MKTLLVIDAQNDFMPGGSLAIPNGNKIIPIINSIQDRFDLIVATQDWHPKEHSSFAINQDGKSNFETIEWRGQMQTLWPEHCIQGSEGAKLLDDIDALMDLDSEPEVKSEPEVGAEIVIETVQAEPRPIDPPAAPAVALTDIKIVAEPSVSPPLSKPRAEAESLHGLKVLIVEDVEANHDVIMHETLPLRTSFSNLPTMVADFLGASLVKV